MPVGRISGINGLYTGFFLCLSMFLRFTFLREMCRNLFWEKYFFICGKDLLISARIVWILVANFLETTCYLFSNFKLIIWFFFYFRRSCRGGTSFFCWAQKKEARKGPGNRLNVRYAPKTRFLLPTKIYRKRGRTSAIRKGFKSGPFWWNFLPPSPPCAHPRPFFLFVETICQIF